MPSSEITLTEKIETSVNPVISRTTARAPTMARPPTSAGIAAATRLPKISRARMTTIGSEISSARARSSEVILLTSPYTANAPARCVSRPSARRVGSSRS